MFVFVSHVQLPEFWKMHKHKENWKYFAKYKSAI